MARPRTAGYIPRMVAEDLATWKLGYLKRGEIREMIAEASSLRDIERIAPGTERLVRDAIEVIASAARMKGLMLSNFSTSHVVEPLLYDDEKKLLHEMRKDPWLRAFCNRVNAIEDGDYEKAIQQYVTNYPRRRISAAYYAIRVMALHAATTAAKK